MTVVDHFRRKPPQRCARPATLAAVAAAAALGGVLFGSALCGPALAQATGVRSLSGSPWPDYLQPGRPAPQPAPPQVEEAPAAQDQRIALGRGSAPLPPPRPADLAAPAAQPAPPAVSGEVPASDSPAPGLPRIAPQPTPRPSDLGVASTTRPGEADGPETSPPQVPRLADPAVNPSTAPDGAFAAMAPLPPVRPEFPLDVQAPDAAPPPVVQAPPQPTKPSWWPFGKKNEAEEPLQESPDGLRAPRRSVTDAEVDACVSRLRRAGAVVQRIRPIASGSCGIRNGVEVTALPGGIPLSKPGTLSCAMVEATGEWLRGVAQPAARQHLKANITAVIIGPTYACRTMNHQRGAKISEHGYANAIDIAGFQFDQRRPYAVRPSHPTAGENLFQNFIRKNACRIFDTVIGPGGDRFHNDHLHLDLRNRGSGRQVCR